MISSSSKEEHIPEEMNIHYEPLKGSEKIYKQGTLHPDLKVPFRKINISATQEQDGSETPNDPLHVYDTSGIYTDPSAKIDISKGLPQLRQKWILERNDVEQLPQATSDYRNQREFNDSLKPIRFPLPQLPSGY